MSATKQQILQAACEIAGGSEALAAQLGVSAAMMRRYLASSFELPDDLLLRTVDIILADREARFFPPPAPAPRERFGDH